MEGKKILIADDEEDIVEVIKDTLETKGFQVVAAYDGEEAVKKVYEESPDLLILDVKMPKMDGYEVVKNLKEDAIHSHLPIIMLTAKGQMKDKIDGFGAGIDDYMTKPFNSFELVARIESILRRAVQDMEANPLTKFPGNIAIANELKKKIIKQDEEKFAVFYLDINNFKAFNDKYGFEKGDKAIVLTSNIIFKVIREMGDSHDFLGHIGGDDFIGIIRPEKIDVICARVIKIFDELIPSLYNAEDRKRGHIVTEDRQGCIRQFPLISLSIGVVTTTKKRLTHVGEISTIGAELKKFAKIKGNGKSFYAIDRRKD